jgi:hypothetical protein
MPVSGVTRISLKAKGAEAGLLEVIGGVFLNI